MRTVRKGLFETNSSSVHSLTIVTEDKYNSWGDDVYFDRYSEKFLSFEEVKQELIEDKWFRKENSYAEDWTDEHWKEYIHNEKQYFTPEEWDDYCEFETFKKTFTTPSGDRMVAFGYFGYDC